MAKRHDNPTKTMTAKTSRSGPAVLVEYPREGETISPWTYTFQIRALPEARCVEIEIDDGSWKPCRESLGLWWYDWAGYSKGEHVVAVRSRSNGNDTAAASAPRRFRVA